MDKKPQTPAGWTLQGLAVHEAIEAWERSNRTMDLTGANDVYESAWRLHLTRMLKDEPDTDKWMTGNPRTKGSVDLTRRFTRGKEQLEQYIKNALAQGWEIWETPDFEPAIELPFRIMVGNIEVVGYIDQIREHPDGSLEIVDIKSGSKIPSWDFQLGVYRLAVLESYGVEINQGSFLMLKDDRMVGPTNLTRFTRERVTAWFDALNRGVEAQVFMPNVGDHCRICGVWKYCSAKERN
ncbi:RecB family exonuclease [Streptomyces cadmiisoli]|uniref:RecB family exonuclease n=1 Tax=Streptomyces cadmiisoli TaxID=2184053 RepID=UPI001FE89402|nr:PD-(D/E)XK nuclease family protein [Streptomyces cadmiisoli]